MVATADERPRAGPRRIREPGSRGPAGAGRHKARADVLLVESGLVASRSQAQALIMAGRVFADERRIDKAGALLRKETRLRLVDGPRFVSRGGDKLDHALARFADAGLQVADAVCVDIGASTGGFTDCLLQHGACRVYAVDVGRGQLDSRLRADPRVVVRERVNARQLGANDFADRIDLVAVDVSFISIATLAETLAGVLAPGGSLVVLVKPQFEAGRREASRGRGVIRDEATRQRAIARAKLALQGAGFEIVAETDSPIRGPKGNLERFVYARRPAQPGQ